MKLFYALILTVFAALPARAEVDIQPVTSPGGITAWLVEEHSIPFVALEIRFRGGASLDAAGNKLQRFRNANYCSSLIYDEVAFVEKPHNLKVANFVCYQQRGLGVILLGRLPGHTYD